MLVTHPVDDVLITAERPVHDEGDFLTNENRTSHFAVAASVDVNSDYTPDTGERNIDATPAVLGGSQKQNGMSKDASFISKTPNHIVRSNAYSLVRVGASERIIPSGRFIDSAC
ncbi:MAG: hypothetical protein ACI9UA_003853 [Pseudoalteromonas tetraodonis]